MSLDLGLSGSKSNTDTSSDSTTSGTTTSQLELSDEAISSIIEQVLGSADGLASVFSSQNASGIYNSSTATQAAGDLVTNIIGELATITGKTVTTNDSSTSTDSSSSTSDFSGKFNFGFNSN